MKALNQWVFHGLTNPWKTLCLSWQLRKIKEIYKSLFFFINNDTGYFIWLVESKNKCFIRKFILYKGIRLFSRKENFPKKNKSHRC